MTQILYDGTLNRSKLNSDSPQDFAFPEVQTCETLIWQQVRKICKKPNFPSRFSILVSFSYFYSQEASFRLDCRPSLPVQISRKPAYNCSINVLFVRLYYVYSERASLLLDCTKLVYKSSVSFFCPFNFYHFYSKRTLLLLGCRPFTSSDF